MSRLFRRSDEWSSETLIVDVASGTAPEQLAAHAHEWASRRRRSVLRWGGVGATTRRISLEVCTAPRSPLGLEQSAASRVRGNDGQPRACDVAFVVPTGLGAAIGGFLGDASPWARKLEPLFRNVITHPNVLNAAALYGGGETTSYVEGLSLDLYLLGQRRLRAQPNRKIGVILDRMTRRQEVVTRNAVAASEAVWDINVVACERAREGLQAHVRKTPHGTYSGRVRNPSTLLRAAERLLSKGANAIAVATVTRGIPKDAWKNHYRGRTANPVGALESLISRGITSFTGVPCAHAPVFFGAMGQVTEVVDPRAAAEVISLTGLPCVIKGLSKAPDLSPRSGIGNDELSCIIIPAGACAGVPAVASNQLRIPLYAVAANQCIAGVSGEHIAAGYRRNVSSYEQLIDALRRESSSKSK